MLYIAADVVPSSCPIMLAIRSISLCFILCLILPSAPFAFAHNAGVDESANGARVTMSQNDPYAQPSRVRLEGQVEHSEHLPELDERFLPGRRFDAKAFRTAPTKEEWVKIPSWLAGVFAIRKSILTAVTNYEKGERKDFNRNEKVETHAVYGHQKDAAGNIWQLNRTPFSAVVRMGRVTQYSRGDTAEFLEVCPDHVVIRHTGPTLLVNSETGMIVRASQTESITVCTPDGANVLARGSIKAFDAQGRAIDCAERIAFLRRTKPFQADPTTEESFKRFLFSQRANAESHR